MELGSFTYSDSGKPIQEFDISVVSHASGGEVTVLIVAVCVCVSVTALAGATRTVRPQPRYQKKALNTRIK